ncbi:hypothetical protein [Dactylosporangium sp. CA-233914]|uniref:DUF7933 domain-containing protein n=1 Tax=Dactylosporangium sp. CA-233914 TaxID=3239934 RepID=UPI003D9075D3
MSSCVLRRSGRRARWATAGALLAAALVAGPGLAAPTAFAAERPAGDGVQRHSEQQGKQGKEGKQGKQGGKKAGRAADKTAAGKTVADTRAADNKAADTRAADNKAADTRAADNKAADSNGVDSKGADKKAADSKSVGRKGADVSVKQGVDADDQAGKARPGGDGTSGTDKAAKQTATVAGRPGVAEINTNYAALTAVYEPATAKVGQTFKWKATLTYDGLIPGSTDGVGFWIDLPTGIVPEGPTTTSCGATVTIVDGYQVQVSQAILSNIVPICTFTADVHATEPGTYGVSAHLWNGSNLSGSTLGATMTATPADATLTGGFSGVSVVSGNPAALSLALDRMPSTDAKSGMAFTLALPTGVTVGSGAPVNECGGTLTATAGQSSVSLASGELPIGVAGCTMTVPLAFATPGLKTIAGADAVTGLSNVTNGIVTSTIDVYPAIPDPQTITFAQPADVAAGTASVSVNPTASSGLWVTVTSGTTDVCTVAPDVEGHRPETLGTPVMLLKPGVCTLTANQAGNGYFAAAPAVARSFSVTPPAPSGVSATAADSSIAVTWLAPQSTTGITGYKAIANPGPATCTTTGALTCILGATAGTTYTVTVVALAGEAQSEPAGPSSAVTPAAPVPPATPPSTNLTLTTDQGQISQAEPGQAITFVGTGFAAYSTVVISMYSAPQVLGTAVTDGAGNFSKPITIPTDLAFGAHTALAQGVAPDGTTRSMALALTVAASAPAPAPAPAPSTGNLAVTGAAVTQQVLVGLALAIAGSGLFRLGRPRRRIA